MYEKISELISRHTKVTCDPVSQKHFGICPFCRGRTDTFMADDRKGIFFCYACGISGDKKDFIERLEPQKHVVITCQKNPLLLRIYEEAAYFYYTELTKADHPGRQYLADRGISMDGIREYSLWHRKESSMTKKELRENLKEVEENAEISAKEAYEKLENDGELEGLESD